MTKVWGVTNTVYVEAASYEEAIKTFWETMNKADIGSAVNADPLPRCFVSEVEGVNPTSVLRDRG